MKGLPRRSSPISVESKAVTSAGTIAETVKDRHVAPASYVAEVG
jgi:hypothetical protein